MFEKSLQDLVKTLRAVKGDAAPVIAKAIQDIKDELKSRDVVVKAQALQKLCYVRGFKRSLRFCTRCCASCFRCIARNH